jgi:YVTN family beta-propeller protein
MPLGVAASPDGTVSVTSTATKTISATIGVGGAPIAAAVFPDGSVVYVVNKGSRTVSAISTATDAVAATVPVGNAPIGIAIAPGRDRRLHR